MLAGEKLQEEKVLGVHKHQNIFVDYFDACVYVRPYLHGLGGFRLYVLVKESLV